MIRPVQTRNEDYYPETGTCYCEYGKSAKICKSENSVMDSQEGENSNFVATLKSITSVMYAEVS